MIYTNSGGAEYKVKFYLETKTGRTPVKDYIERIPTKEKAKILKYIEFLRIHRGVLDEPFTKHVRGKIRELRVDFFHNKHRIFYFTFIHKTIILLHAFSKNTAKTPPNEIKRAENHYEEVILNKEIYE